MAAEEERLSLLHSSARRRPPPTSRYAWPLLVCTAALAAASLLLSPRPLPFSLRALRARFASLQLIGPAAPAPPPSAAFMEPTAPPPLPLPSIPLSPWRHILNESLRWAEMTVPRFVCSDDEITKSYWYRWRLFHLHMARGPRRNGCGEQGCWVLTEFLRKVFWSGPHNTIVAPAGHHIMEGRWIYDRSVVDDYARFWFGGGGFKKQAKR